MATVEASARRGVAWVGGLNLASQVLGMVSSIVLARLLTPRDFGLVGMAMLVVGLASSVRDLGFNSAAVQKLGFTRAHEETLFALNLLLGGGFWILVVAGAPLAAAFFRAPEVVWPIRLLACLYLVNAMACVPGTGMARRLEFRRLSIIEFSAEVAAAAAGIALAVLHSGPWALVGARLVAGVWDTGFKIVFGGLPPAPRLSRAAVEDLSGFALGMTLRSVLTNLAENIDNFVVGRWLGATALGLYDRAYSVVSLPASKVLVIATRVFFPVFSRIQNDPDRLGRNYVTTLCAASLIAFPVLAGTAVVAPLLVPLLLGSQWGGAVVPLQILCFAGAFQALAPFCHALLDARGRMAPQVTRQGLQCAFVLAGVAAGSLWGIEGAAGGVLAAFAASWAVFNALVMREIGVTWGQLLRAFLPAAACSAVMAAGAAAVLGAAVTQGLPAAGRLAGATVAGGAIYLLALAGLARLTSDPLLHAILAAARPVLARLRLRSFFGRAGAAPAGEPAEAEGPGETGAADPHAVREAWAATANGAGNWAGQQEALAAVVAVPAVSRLVAAAAALGPGPGLLILNYHRVWRPASPADVWDDGVISATPEEFDDQMRLLREHATPLSLADGLEALQGGRPLPPRAVAVTFDDGYRDNAEHALPSLVRWGVPATFFVACGYIEGDRPFWWDLIAHVVKRTRRPSFDIPLGNGGEGVRIEIRDEADRRRAIHMLLRLAKELPDARRQALVAALPEAAEVEVKAEAFAAQVMTWADLARLASSGMELGSHTVNHPILARVRPEALRREVAESKRMLEARLGRPVRFFSIPVGGPSSFTPAVSAAIAAAGYEAACNSLHGVNRRGADPYALRRVFVEQTVSRRVFRSLVCCPDVMARVL